MPGRAVRWTYDDRMEMFDEGRRGQHGPHGHERENSKPHPVTVTFSPQLADKLRKYADSHKMNFDEAAESLLWRALETTSERLERVQRENESFTWEIRLDPKEKPDSGIQRRGTEGSNIVPGIEGPWDDIFP